MLMVPIRIENTGRRLSSAQRRSKGSLATGQRRWYVQWYGVGQKVRRKEIVSPLVVYRGITGAQHSWDDGENVGPKFGMA